MVLTTLLKTGSALLLALPVSASIQLGGPTAVPLDVTL